MGIANAVCAGDLRNGLESKYAAAAELAQARECILQAVDFSQCIELIHDEPQMLIALGTGHGLEDPDAHPGGYRRSQRCDLIGAIGNE